MRLIVTFIFLAGGVLLHAQDLHFSQFYHNPMHFSPAAAGMYVGDLRFSALYRNQWSSVPVQYNTFSGAGEWKAWRRGTEMLSLGLNLQRDQAGDAALSWLQGGLNLSVAHALDATQAVSVGIGLQAVQRTVDFSRLRFRNQWTGDVFDPSLPSKETFGRASGVQPSLAAGVSYLYNASGRRNHVLVSVGGFHINRPDIGFRDDVAYRLPVRLAGSIVGALQLQSALDIVWFAGAQKMGTAEEIMVGSGIRYMLGASGDASVQFSIGTRLGDAWFPAFQFSRNNWTVGLSYDWNTSPFDIATAGKGGIEIAVVYRSIPAPPVKTFKTCPIF